MTLAITIPCFGLTIALTARDILFGYHDLFTAILIGLSAISFCVVLLDISRSGKN